LIIIAHEIPLPDICSIDLLLLLINPKKVPAIVTLFYNQVPGLIDKKFWALRAYKPHFPGSLTRKLFRKKIPEIAIKVPGNNYSI